MVELKLRMKFGDLLKERNMTQKTLSEQTGLRPAVVSALSRGIVERLTIDHIERIADALGITDLTELMSLEKRKKQSGA